MVNLTVHIANPRETILLSCRGTASVFGKTHSLDELFPTEWHTPVSNAHKLYAVVVPKAHHAAELISSSKVFAVNFVDFSAKEAVARIRHHLGETVDKFLLSGFSRIECERIDCCRIAESAGFLECELVSQFDGADCIVFVGKVVNFSFKENVKRLFFVGGEDYTTLI